MFKIPKFSLHTFLRSLKWPSWVMSARCCRSFWLESWRICGSGTFSQRVVIRPLHRDSLDSQNNSDIKGAEQDFYPLLHWKHAADSSRRPAAGGVRWGFFVIFLFSHFKMQLSRIHLILHFIYRMICSDVVRSFWVRFPCGEARHQQGSEWSGRSSP